VFLDSGSQRSYILKKTAESLKLPTNGSKAVMHELFGGTQTGRVLHSKYIVGLESITDEYQCQLEVRDQAKISNSIPRVPVYDEKI